MIGHPNLIQSGEREVTLTLPQRKRQQ